LAGTALSPGTRLGVYEVIAPIGEGGMGQVFRARDSRLERDVAIKTLPEAFAHDADRLARFQREAKTLAALNHPHIAGVYGLEEAAGVTALVMELVEGDDLSQRMARGAMPLDDALPVARQIAEALEAAHDQGIIHRDLKPANIKVRSDGTVKILDFGLAKAMEPLPGVGLQPSAMNSPTLSLHATHAGVILGTAAYMSPEQAAGKPVDKRADVWSFGVVLWEMLTGQSLFGGGETVSHMVADVLRAPVDFEKVPAGPLRQLLQRCLDRDVKTRLRDIGEARVILGRVASSEPLRDHASRAHQATPKTTRLWMIATAAMTVLAGVAFWGWLKPTPTEPRPLIHFTMGTPEGAGVNPIAVSRDGSHLAFVNAAQDKIYVRRMDDPAAKPLPGTENGHFPTFSPDGQSLAFVAGVAAPYELKRIPIAGGAPLTLAGGIGVTTPMSWGDDGNLLLGGQEILRVSETGGKPVTMTRADRAKGEFMLATPQLLPGGKHILASVLTDKGMSAFPIVAIDVASGHRTVLLDGVGEARFVPTGRAAGTGHLLYVLNGSLFAAAFNAATLGVGPVAPVLEGLRNLGGLSHLGFSHSGTLAYVGRDNVAFGNASTLTWVDRQGTEQPLAAPARPYVSPKISPDGSRVAFHVIETRQMIDLQVWVHDLARGTTTRLTVERINTNPVWSADGKRVVYASSSIGVNANGTLTSVAADGSAPPVTLMGESASPSPTSVSADGKLVIGVRSPGRTRSGTEAWVLALGGDATPAPFLDTRFTRGEFQFSPDGKWVAYESNEGGRNEIYVVPYPGPGGKSQVSTDGGTQPRWNRNGRELFFRAGAKLMAVDVETGALFRAGAARTLFEKVSSDYDVTPDGKRFLMLKPATATADPTEIHVILNWFADLRRRVPLPQ
jgi:Tol biopolymer transport system component